MRENSCSTLRSRVALLRACDGNTRLLRRTLDAQSRNDTADHAPPGLRQYVRERPDGADEPGAAALPISPADERFLALADAAVIAADDAEYPPLLAEIRESPPLLFCRGNVAALSRPQIAIVGSRNASPAGLANARAFAADLAAAGFVITSGMALGVDAMAHEGALAAGGETVAVLGCGADVVYPRRHASLAERIRGQGCIVSEFLPGTPPLAPLFPQRNRIISALVLGVLVVEAAPDSGSLITARFAAEQGREVFALPGSIHSPVARGCHQLIREGATLIETSAQLVESLMHFAAPVRQLALPMAASSEQQRLTDEEASLLALLSPAGSSVDALVAASGAPVARTSALLSALTIRGLAHALPGGLWQPAGHAQ
jgi:DNA processing protein